MQIDIEATNLELTPPLREYIEEKMGKLDKFLARFGEENVHMRIEVARDSKHHRHGDVYRAQANLSFPGGMFHSEHKSSDVRVAVNRVSSKLQREIRKHKPSY